MHPRALELQRLQGCSPSQRSLDCEQFLQACLARGTGWRCLGPCAVEPRLRPACSVMCRCRVSLWSERGSQCLFTTVYKREDEGARRVNFLAKAASHTEHWCGRCPRCRNLCLVRCSARWKTAPQMSQGRPIMTLCEAITTLPMTRQTGVSGAAN